jgi:restriction system protein
MEPAHGRARFSVDYAPLADARAYVNNIDFKVVLIDGKRLADLMIDYDIGLNNVLTYQLKRIDSDYFSEDG